jgi:hypothetical protein
MEKISAIIKIDNGSCGQTVELVEKPKTETMYVLFEKMTKDLISEVIVIGFHNVSADKLRAVTECAQVLVSLPKHI